MAEFEFHYTSNDQDLNAFREEGIRRFGLLQKGMDSNLSPEGIYNQLYHHGLILCIISDSEAVRGMMVLHECDDILAGKSLLVVDAAQLDNVPGILDAMHDEVERLVAMDQYDAVRWQFKRKGWIKKMKMQPEKGYKVVAYVAEKNYGW